MRYYMITAGPGLEKAVEIIGKRLNRRGLEPCPEGYPILLTADPSMPPDSYKISGSGGGVRIMAPDMINILGGAGAFLRDSIFTADGMEPSQKYGIHTADCPVRGVYFARHFHNFYHMAPYKEICGYAEDLTLWGFNCMMLIMPNIDLDREDSPEAADNISCISEIFKFISSIGMKAVFALNTSCTYKNYPKELAFTPLKDELGRHGNSGNIICISKPGGMELIDENNRFLLKAMKERGVNIDIFINWPYDEGGCGCPECSPWGANGYIRASKKAFQTAREYYPDALRMISTWTYDTPPQGEWEELTKSLDEEKWCDIVLADAHEDYPRYPLDHGVPGGLPLVSFPEISMWGLFPWGGYGAVCLPERFTRIWHQTERKLYGELLYSEGIYEDINKAVIAGLCQDYGRDPDMTLAEYGRFELGMPDPAPFAELVHMMERTHTLRAAEGKFDADTAEKAFALACEIDKILPVWSKICWRWRIVYIRALLDSKRFADHGKDGYDICGNNECLDAMHELIGLFHCMKNGFENDPYHGRVRPLCPPYSD